MAPEVTFSARGRPVQVRVCGHVRVPRTYVAPRENDIPPNVWSTFGGRERGRSKRAADQKFDWKLCRFVGMPAEMQALATSWLLT